MKQYKSNPNKKYWALCNECGAELYPDTNKKEWGAITVSMGKKCPRCGKKAILVPLDDWEGREFDHI